MKLSDCSTRNLIAAYVATVNALPHNAPMFDLCSHILDALESRDQDAFHRWEGGEADLWTCYGIQPEHRSYPCDILPISCKDPYAASMWRKLYNQLIISGYGWITDAFSGADTIADGVRRAISSEGYMYTADHEQALRAIDAYASVLEALK